MRIGLLIYGNLESISGGYLYDRKLVEYLRQQGDTVEIISLAQRSYQNELWFPPDLLSQLDTSIDILVQDELVHPSVLRINSRIRNKYAIPVVGLVHLFTCCANQPGWKAWFYRLTERHYINSIDALIVNSKHTLKQASDLMDGQPLPPHMVALPAGDNFDGMAFDKPGLRPQHHNTLKILSVGNLIQQKGIHVLLEALRKAPDIDFELLVCGRLDMEPQYTRYIHNLIKHPHLEGRVALQGPLDRPSLASLYAASDVFVLPSVNEAYGIVYLEAQQFGLPAIGTTAGGAGEIITDGVNGYLIKPGDSTALAARLGTLYRERSLSATFGEQARLAYARHPRWQDTCAGIRTFLLEQITRNGARH